MSVKVEEFLVCDNCGKRRPLHSGGAWLRLTQPPLDFCQECFPLPEVQERVARHSPHLKRGYIQGGNEVTQSNADRFDEDYFLHGRDKGLSLYEDYRWLPDMTIPMVKRMIEHCRILQSHTVLDFGCARGYVVRAFRELGIRAYGIDTSKWAIQNADPAAHIYVTNNPVCTEDIYDWVIAKDVLEHVEYVNEVILKLMQVAQVGVFAVVPLAPVSLAGAKYIIPDYEKDVTHIHRMALYSWMNFFFRPGWAVEGRYRVQGIKDNWYRPGWERGNGFITAQRIQE